MSNQTNPYQLFLMTLYMMALDVLAITALRARVAQALLKPCRCGAW
ncbi:MAG: hypothetical protein JJU24_15885 [Natronohydrobacter sp.]|nr:hypothetical protein [Natronohydrobacter sp.]